MGAQIGFEELAELRVQAQAAVELSRLILSQVVDAQRRYEASKAFLEADCFQEITESRMGLRSSREFLKKD